MSDKKWYIIMQTNHDIWLVYDKIESNMFANSTKTYLEYRFQYCITINIVYKNAYWGDMSLVDNIATIIDDKELHQYLSNMKPKNGTIKWFED